MLIRQISAIFEVPVFVCLHDFNVSGQEPPKVWFLSVKPLGRCGPRFVGFFYVRGISEKSHKIELE